MLRGRRKVTTGQSTASNKKGTKTSMETNVTATTTLKEGTATTHKKGTVPTVTAASTTASTTLTEPSDEGTRVTRSFTQCHPRFLCQVQVYPRGHPAIATGGSNEEDSSSSEVYVAKGNAFC